MHVQTIGTSRSPISPAATARRPKNATRLSLIYGPKASPTLSGHELRQIVAAMIG